jgi:hypothetical protein
VLPATTSPNRYDPNVVSRVPGPSTSVTAPRALRENVHSSVVLEKVVPGSPADSVCFVNSPAVPTPLASPS